MREILFRGKKITLSLESRCLMNKRPDKLKLKGMTHKMSDVENLRSYNEAIDECRAYYESDEYIQHLIDSGRVGIDEDKVIKIFNKHIIYEIYQDDESNVLLDVAKAISQSNPIKVVKDD